MKDNKVIAGLIAIGFIVGAIAVYPIAHASQAVKTVTKTQRVVSHAKIENGLRVSQLAPFFGNPAGQTQQASSTNGGISCWAWISSTTRRAPIKGDWEVKLCVKTQ